MLKRLNYILLVTLFFAIQVVVQAQYVIDKVCKDAVRTYRVDEGVGEPVVSYNWILKDASGNTIPISAGSPSGKGSEIEIKWSFIPGVYNLSVEKQTMFGCSVKELGTIEVIPVPKVDAGPDQTVCMSAGTVISLSKATAKDITSSGIEWTTSGDGLFNNPVALNPIYTPGPGDLLAEKVTLKLTAKSLSDKTDGCIQEDEIAIKLIPQPKLVITDPKAVCEPDWVDLTAASVTIGSTIPSGVVPTYWTDAAGTLPLPDPRHVVKSGTYYIKVDVLGACHDIQPVKVIVSSQPKLVIKNPSAVCEPGMVDISASYITAGSDLGLTFSYWTDANATAPLLAYSAIKSGGTYYIKATSAIGCSNIQPITVVIIQKSTPQFNLKNLLCLNSAAPALPTTSTDGFKGTWNPSVVSTSSLGPASYVFTPDPGECALPFKLDITITDEIKPVFAAIGPFCVGDSPTALPLTSTNGIAGKWSPATISTATAGTTVYTFTPDDATQCFTSFNLPVTINTPGTLTFDPIAPICQNSTNPLPPKSKEGISGKWSPAFSSAASGTITYTFTPDAGQCAISSTLDITVVPSVPVTFDPLGSFCAGDPAPTLPATSKEGISGTWSPAVVDMTQSGTYNFTADGGLCASYALPVVIYRLNLTETHVDLGYSTSPIGSIDLTVSGGSGYSYSWTGPSGFTSSSQDLTGLAAGDYRVVVKDLSTNCEEKLTVTLTQSILTVSFTSTPVTCFGGNNGTAIANPSGGLPPYKYLWDNGQTGQTISGLSSGTYDVTVTDAKGIGSTGSVYIIQPPELIVTATQISAPDCSVTAQVLVAASGGTPGYNGVGTFLATAGPHTFTVTDANGCSKPAIVNVVLYDRPLAPTTNLIQPTCFDPTGTIEFTTPIPSAGISFSVTGPSPVNITTQNTTGVFSGLVAGIYSVSTVNSNGCPSDPISVTISAPPVIPSNPVAKPITECEKNPIQTLNANAGIVAPPLGTVIVWYDALTGGNVVANPILNTPTTITYFAEARNSECASNSRTPVTLTILPLPSAPISKGDLSACESSPLVILDARDAIDATGKTIVWYDKLVGGNLVTFPTLNAVKTVTYYAENVSGTCSSSPRTPVTLSIFTLPAKPTAVVSVVPRCIDTSGVIEVKTPIGSVFNYSIDNGPYQSSATFTNQTPGNHFIRVKNTITTCESGATVLTVPNIPPVPHIINLTVENCICYGDSGKLNFEFANVVDGTYVIVYVGGQFNNVKVVKGKASILAPAGVYNVLAIEANGCTSSENWNVEIKQPDQISVSAKITEIDLKSKQKGEIDITISGGTGPYQTIWKPNLSNGFAGATTEDIKNLNAGIYTVTVTDASGCLKTFIDTIPKANLPPIATDDNFLANCNLVTGDLLYTDNGNGVDSDPDNDPIAIDVKPVRTPSHGILTINSDGTFEYKAFLGYTGDDTFIYVIYDVKKNYSNPAMVTIHIVSDTDRDGIADNLDPDADGDGILNVDEVLAGQDWETTDNDGDGYPNYLDIDSDNDGIVDNVEAQSTPGYIKPSGVDKNNDGIDDAYDPAQGGTKIVPIDTESDGIPDYLDVDSDGDGVPDYIEGHDLNADGKPDHVLVGKDTDGDGLGDGFDTIINECSLSENVIGSNAVLQDFDGDGLRDWRDTNDDDDEYPTRVEDLNGNGDWSDDVIGHPGHPEYLWYGRDCELFIPNAFSPNDDNIHDYFQIYCIESYPNARMYIFDQLGNLLYQQEHYGNLEFWKAPERAWWDGRTKNRAVSLTGGKVPPGTYYYVLNLGNGDVRKSFVFISY